MQKKKKKLKFVDMSFSVLNCEKHSTDTQARQTIVNLGLS